MQKSSAGAFFCRGWTAPKAGNSAAQNEDAFRVHVDQQEETATRLMLALSDGTTEAIYSGLWARRLIEAAEPEWPLLSLGELQERLTPVRATFVPWNPSSDVPWYVRNKYLLQGSQATLLVLSAHTEQNGAYRLQVCAIGDCCVLLIKESGDVLAFPISESSGFGQNPGLIGTRPQPELEIAYGQAIWQTGDLLLACTDAVAQWALKCLETGQAALLFGLLGRLLEEDGSDKSSSTATDSEEVARQEQRPVGYFAKLVQAFWGNTEDINMEAAEPACDTVERHFADELRKLRDPESDPCLRNDDSTLILCTALGNTGSPDAQEAQGLLLRLQQALDKPKLCIKPMESPTLNSVEVLLRAEVQCPVAGSAACQ